MIMRKLFVLLTMSLLVVAASAQKLSWPPKSYPVKVPFTVSEEVKYYWDVQGFSVRDVETEAISSGYWE